MRKMRRDLADQKDVFFFSFYLAVTSLYVNLT